VPSHRNSASSRAVDSTSRPSTRGPVAPMTTASGGTATGRNRARVFDARGPAMQAPGRHAQRRRHVPKPLSVLSAIPPIRHRLLSEHR
jgi:hypothetical protein